MAARIFKTCTCTALRNHTVSSLCRTLWRTSILTLFLSLTFCGAKYKQFENTYDPSNPDIVFQNLLVDTNGDLYIGSVNELYKLGSDLNEIRQFSTGPVMDNRECRPPPTVCDSASQTNNINKLLLMYEGEILTCSNIFQGSCQSRNPNTLEIVANYSREVVSNYYHGSAVAFIAPGPDGDALYTATPSGDWLRSGIPSIARRLLKANPIFGDDPFDAGSTIVVPINTIQEANVQATYAFNISYVHGFSSGSHSYFLALQVENYKIKDSPQRTKVARVCQQDAGDPFFESYIELPLQCSDGVTNYNLAQSAFLATVGSDMADVKAGEDVLFVTFSESIGGNSLEPTTKSAVCLYSLKAIDAMMAERRIQCARGETDNTEIEWLGNTPCFDDQTVVSYTCVQCIIHVCTIFTLYHIPR